MSMSMDHAMAGLRAELRHLPIDRRVRAVLGDETVVDCTRAVLVWEPRRISPMYGVPVHDVRGDLVPDGPVQPGGPALLHPGVPFGVHSTDGEAFSLTVRGRTLHGAAFRPADPDLGAYVLLDFDAFDGWLDEDEPIGSHPRDPYHRVDAQPSSRHVRIEDRGRLIAESRQAVLVFETELPTRFYLPREDVVTPLRSSDLVTHCPYKGQASYWSIDGHRDLAWSYLNPLPEAARLQGLIAFYDDVLEVTVDGVRRERPNTATAKVMLREFGVET